MVFQFFSMSFPQLQIPAAVALPKAPEVGQNFQLVEGFYVLRCVTWVKGRLVAANLMMICMLCILWIIYNIIYI